MHGFKHTVFSTTSTYQFLLKLCEGKGDIGIGGGWGETKETKLAENGGVVVQRFRNLYTCRGKDSIARVLNSAHQRVKCSNVSCCILLWSERK